MEENRRELCVVCSRSVLRQRRHLITQNIIQSRPFVEEYIRSNFLHEVSFEQVVFTCHRCWQRINTAERAHRTSINVGTNEENNRIDEASMEPVSPEPPQPPNLPQLARASNTANRCIFGVVYMKPDSEYLTA